MYFSGKEKRDSGKTVRDAGFSWKRSGNPGSGTPPPYFQTLFFTWKTRVRNEMWKKANFPRAGSQQWTAVSSCLGLISTVWWRYVTRTPDRAERHSLGSSGIHYPLVSFAAVSKVVTQRLFPLGEKRCVTTLNNGTFPLRLLTGPPSSVRDW